MQNASLIASVQMPALTWSTPAAYMSEKGIVIIVVADRSGYVTAVSADSIEILWQVKLGEVITGSPTLADVNDDGLKEIVIGTEQGELFALNSEDGSVVWKAVCGKAIRATAAVADVDGDGVPEVLVGGYGPWMFCLDGVSGNEKWKRYLPKHEFFGGTKQGVVSSPLVADVDLDGELEVVTGMRSRRLYCMSARTGKLKWFREFRYDPDSSPSFAVVDGHPVVFFGGGEHTSGVGDNGLLALRGNDGSTLWKSQFHGGVDSSPVIDDINGDGRLEVVVTSLADASCYACDAITGEIVWRYRFGPTKECIHDKDNVCRLSDAAGRYFTEDAVCRSYTTPLVADIDGDEKKEVVVGSNNGQLVVLDGANGQVKQLIETGGMVRGSPILMDLDGDGSSELIVSSGGELKIYSTKATDHMEWSMFKGEPTHLGWVSPVPEQMGGGRKLPGQRFMRVRLLWCWWVVDFFRYLLFQLERRLLSRLKIKLLPYYY